jgi:hypothetical protein
VIGEGERFFADVGSTRMRLLEATTIGDRLVSLRY